MSKTSFPQHMRNAQAALGVLAAECKKYDPEGRDWIVLVSLPVTEKGGRAIHCSVWEADVPGLPEMPEMHYKVMPTFEDAATALLHAIAGTEEAPF